MMQIVWTCAVFLLGFSAYTIQYHVKSAITNRRLYGKPIMVGRKRAGHVVVLRYNGWKKYAYVNDMGDLSKFHYLDRDEAIEACRNAFNETRPKQTSFARAV
jgi:hypothetical protein